MYPTNRGLFHGTHQRQYYLDDDLAENNGNVSTIQGVRQGTVRFKNQGYGQQTLASNGHYKDYGQKVMEQAELERMSHWSGIGQDPNRKAQPHKAKHSIEKATTKPRPTYLGPGFVGGEKEDYQDISHNNSQSTKLATEEARSQQDMRLLDRIWKELSDYYFSGPEELRVVLVSLLEINVHPHLGRVFTEVRDHLQFHLDWWEEWQTSRYHEDMINQLDAKWSEVVLEAWLNNYSGLPGVTCLEEADWRKTQEHFHETQGQGRQPHTTQDSGGNSGRSSLVKVVDFKSANKHTKFNQISKGLMVLRLKTAAQLHGVLSGLLNIEVHPVLGRMFTQVREQLQNHLDSWEEWQTARYHEDMVNQLDAQWSEVVLEAWLSDYNGLPELTFIEEELQRVENQTEGNSRQDGDQKTQLTLDGGGSSNRSGPPSPYTLNNQDQGPKNLLGGHAPRATQQNNPHGDQAHVKVEQQQVNKDERGVKLTKEEEPVSIVDALDLQVYECLYVEENWIEEVDQVKRAAEQEREAFDLKLKEANKQIEYLKETKSIMKVEYDLEHQKLRREFDMERSDAVKIMDKKDAEVDDLKQQLVLTRQELELAREEAEEKIDDLQTELEVREAGFSNCLKESEESHKREVAGLRAEISKIKSDHEVKVEEANKEVAGLKGKISKIKSDYEVKVDERLALKKHEVNDLQEKLLEKEKHVQDFKAIEREVSREKEELRVKKEEMEDRIRSLATDIESAQHENGVLSIKITKKKRQIREAHQKVESMKVTMDRQQCEIEDLNSRLDSENSRSYEIQKRCREWEAERLTMLAKLEDHQQTKDQLASYLEKETVLLDNIEDLKKKLASTLIDNKSKHAEHSTKLPEQQNIAEKDDLGSDGCSGHPGKLPVSWEEPLHGETMIVGNNPESPTQCSGQVQVNGANVEYACLLSRGELLESLPSSRQECELEEMPYSEDTILEGILRNSEDSLAIHEGVKSGPVVETKGLFKQEKEPLYECMQAVETLARSSQRTGSAQGQQATVAVSIEVKEGASAITGLAQKHVKEVALETSGLQRPLESLSKSTKGLKPTDVRAPADEVNKRGMKEDKSLLPPSAFGEEDLLPGAWCSSMELNRGENLKGFLGPIGEVEDLSFVNIPRCLRKYSLAHTNIQVNEDKDSERLLEGLNMVTVMNEAVFSGDHGCPLPAQLAMRTQHKGYAFHERGVYHKGLLEGLQMDGVTNEKYKNTSGYDGRSCDPHFQCPCKDQRDCFCGWERFTKLESIQWLADAEPANEKEGASGVLHSGKNDPMEGATKNNGLPMLLEALPKSTQRLKLADEKMPAKEQDKCTLNEDTSFDPPSAFGEEDLSPAPWCLSVEQKTGIFVILSTEYYTFSDPSSRATSCVIYCALRYLHGLSTVRQVICKSKITPREQKQTTMPRIELDGPTIGAQSAKESIDTSDLSVSQGFWMDSFSMLRWTRSEKSSVTCCHDRVKKIRQNTSTGQWQLVPTKQNPAHIISRGTKTVDELLGSNIWFRGPEFLYISGDFWPTNPQQIVLNDEAKREMVKAVEYQSFLVAQVDRDLDWLDGHLLWHPGRFATLASVVSFIQVSRKLTQHLKNYTARVMAGEEYVRENMRCNLKGTERELEELRRVRDRKDRKELEHCQRSVTGDIKLMEKVPWVEEIPQLTWERSEGFRDLLDPSVRQALTDSVPERFEHLDGQLERGVHDSYEVHSILGREKRIISESGVLASGNKYPRANDTRLLEGLPRDCTLTGLEVEYKVPWSARVVRRQRVYPLAERGMRQSRFPLPCPSTHQERVLWNNLGVRAPSSTRLPCGGKAHSEGEYKERKDKDKFYHFRMAGFHDCTHEQTPERLSSRMVHSTGRQMDKVRSMESHLQVRRVPPDKLDSENAGLHHEEELEGEQTCLGAEHYRNKKDYMPKRIHGQGTIADLPEFKQHASGEVELDLVARPCPGAQLLLRTEREHSQNNSAEVRPRQTKVLMESTGVLAWERIPIKSCSRMDKAQLEKHSPVKLRNTFKLEPRSGFDLPNDSRMGTELRKYNGLQEWACGKAEVLPGGLVVVLNDKTCNELLHSKAMIMEDNSVFLVQDMVRNLIEGLNLEYPRHLSEGGLLEFMPRSRHSELEAMPNSEDTGVHGGERKDWGVGQILQNIGDCLLTHDSNIPEMVFDWKRIGEPDGEVVNEVETVECLQTQNMDDSKATEKHPAVFNLPPSLVGDQKNPYLGTSPGEHAHCCQCYQGSDRSPKLQSCPSHREGDVIGQLRDELAQREECGHQVFETLRDTFHCLAKCGCVGSKDLRKTLGTPARIYWRMLKNLRVGTN